MEYVLNRKGCHWTGLSVPDDARKVFDTEDIIGAYLRVREELGPVLAESRHPLIVERTQGGGGAYGFQMIETGSGLVVAELSAEFNPRWSSLRSITRTIHDADRPPLNRVDFRPVREPAADAVYNALRRHATER